jgi:SAM-dependent methyltransferase
MENTISQLISILKTYTENGNLFKITFSKPRGKESEKSFKLDPFESKEGVLYQLKSVYATKEEVKNYEIEDLWVLIEDILVNKMFFANVFCEEGDFQILQNKKSEKIIRSSQKTSIKSTPHNRKKQYLIQQDRPYLIELGISSFSGNVFNHSQNKYRQINKFVEIVMNLLKDESKLSIADMGCGKGYLSFALYDYLTSKGIKTSFTGYEIREDIVYKANAAAEKCGFDGLKFETEDIQNINLKDIDLVIALHACDVATDIAISKGIKANAKYIIVSPCCQKQVRKDMDEPSSLTPMLKHGILKERMAEMLTDSIRALLLEANGYDTKVFEFISSEHTGKNLMIVAEKGQGNKNAIKHIENLKSQFGVKQHFLEDLLSSKA